MNMPKQIVCCGGPISFYAASAFLSCYIVVLNVLQIIGCALHLVPKIQSWDWTDRWLQGRLENEMGCRPNLAVFCTCSCLIINGFVIWIAACLKSRVSLLIATVVFIFLAALRLYVAIVVFNIESSWVRLLGDIFTVAANCCSSVVFCWYVMKIKTPNVNLVQRTDKEVL
ncbi:hypothetical protein J6590_058478 [Homalodisca vitripennis]|nr:hypothetical protein J6590_058478 [Homalodisca vitripennis]